MQITGCALILCDTKNTADQVIKNIIKTCTNLESINVSINHNYINDNDEFETQVIYNYTTKFSDIAYDSIKNALHDLPINEVEIAHLIIDELYELAYFDGQEWSYGDGIGVMEDVYRVLDIELPNDEEDDYY